MFNLYDIYIYLKNYPIIYSHRSDDEGTEEGILNAPSNPESTDKEDQMTHTEFVKIRNKTERKVQTEEVTNKLSSFNNSNKIPDKKISEDAPTNSKKKRKKRKSNASNVEIALEPKSVHQSLNNQPPRKLKENKPNPFKSADHNQSTSTNTTNTIFKPTVSKSKPSNTNSQNPFRGNENNIKKGNGQANSQQTSRFVSNKIQKKKFDLSKKISNSRVNISDERLKAYGINPKKFHKQQKYGNPQN